MEKLEGFFFLWFNLLQGNQEKNNSFFYLFFLTTSLLTVQLRTEVM